MEETMDYSSLIYSPCNDTCDNKSSELPRKTIAAVFIRNSVDVDDDDDDDDVKNLLVCHTCLSMDTIKPLSAEQTAAFTQTTGVSVAEARLPCALCATCAAYLHKAARFREASARAELVLRDLACRGMLTKTSIKGTERKDFNLSHLIMQNIFNYNLDLNINEKTDELLKIEPFDSLEGHFIENDLDFKVEDKQLIEFQSETIKEHDKKGIINKELNFKVRKRKKSKNGHKISKKSKIINTDFESDFSNAEDNLDLISLKKCEENKLERGIEYNEKKDEDIRDKMEKIGHKMEKIGHKMEKIGHKIEKNRHKTEKNREKHDNNQLNDFFSIETLNFEQQKEEFSKRKENSSYKTLKLKCELCFKGFLHEKAFNTHMAKHSKKVGEYLCQVCHKHCASQTVLRNHVDGFHKYKLHCKKCDYITNNRSSARLHIGWHNGKKYNCDKCDQVFTRQSSFLSHKRIKHASDHACHLCGYSFLGEKGLTLHRLLKHKLEDSSVSSVGGGAPSCAECDITFCNEDALNTHRRVSPKHGGCKRNEAPPSPPKRRRELVSRPRLLSRDPKIIKDRTDKKNYSEPIECEQCGLKVFSTKEYCVHFNKAHPGYARTIYPVGAQTTLCSICGRTFQNAAMLCLHMADHTPGPPKHKCDICGKLFKHKGNLTIHTNIHLGKRFPCPICGKSFNQAFNRDRHYTFVHSSVKDVKCDYCDKYFKSLNEKKLHTTYVHLKKPYNKRSRSRRDCLPSREA